MAGGEVFEVASQALETATSLDRLEARGTLRLALKEAGLDASTVSAEQMNVVLERVLPAELEARGVADADGVCRTITGQLELRRFEPAGEDRVAAAAATLGRFGT